ncbi:MAG: hypothetical protein R2698_02905 [Microthrixaceae bacterium]
MKRALVLLSIPAIVAVVWWFATRPPGTATAEASIRTDDVMRTRVELARLMRSVDADLLTEESSSDDTARFTYGVPAAAADDVLDRLRDLGGELTDLRRDDRVDVVDASAIASAANSVAECTRRSAEATASAVERQSCLMRAEDLRQRVNAAPHSAEHLDLTIDISKASHRNVALTVALTLCALALVLLAFFTLRSARHADEIDLRDSAALLKEELHQRRN